jgi:hypothetical protein
MAGEQDKDKGVAVKATVPPPPPLPMKPIADSKSFLLLLNSLNWIQVSFDYDQLINWF